MSVLAGFSQFFTAICGIGWIWSVSHGCSLVANSRTYTEIEDLRNRIDFDENKAADDGDPFANAKPNA